MRESWDVTIREAGQTRDDGDLVARWVWVLMRMCRKEVTGCDRPRCLWVLRHSGSEPETRRTGSVATSLLSNSLLVARAGNVELDRYPQLMLPGAEIR